MDNILEVFRDFWSGSGNFEGRMSKEEFWRQIWPNAIPGLVLFILSQTLGRDYRFLTIIFSIYYLVFLIPLFSAMSRRLKDAGCSRWNLIWFFLSCIGWIVLAYKLSKPSVDAFGVVGTVVYPAKPVSMPGSGAAPAADSVPAPQPEPVVDAEIVKEEHAEEKPAAEEQAEEPAEKEYYEKDNVGTRHDTLSQATGYWMGERMGLSVKPQFTMYRFATAEEAEAALLEMPFMHKAKDTGKLVCDRLMTFGYYDTADGSEKPYEALITGRDFTLDEYKKAEAAFEEHGGKLKNHLEPDASIKAPAGEGDPSKVTFSGTEKGNDGMSVYEVYKAPDKACAIAFLKTKTVTRGMYYIVVDTPEGSFGRDINGLYQE